MRLLRTPRLRAGIDIASELALIEDAAERRAARIACREELAGYRLQARQVLGVAKLADAMAKFGGGSLLTATLLLVINGNVSTLTMVVVAFALLLFAISTISWAFLEQRAAQIESAAERLDAVLKETER